MCIYTSAQGKSNRSHSKSEFQNVFIDLRPPCWCPSAPTWHLHTELYKFAWNVSANNSRTVSRTDLKRLGEIVYLLIFYNICNF